MEKRKFFKQKEVTKDKRPVSEDLEIEHQKVREEKSILSWKSPARVFKKKSKQYFTTVAVIALVLMIVSALLQWWMAIGVILALVFVVYVLGTVEPEEILHKITKDGLVIADHAYLWGDLKSFWFERQSGHDLLVIETKKTFPSRLILLLGSVTRAPIQQLLKNHLTYRETPPVDWIDKVAKTIAEKIPLED